MSNSHLHASQKPVMSRFSPLRSMKTAAAATLLLLMALADPAGAQELHRPDQQGVELSPRVRQLLEQDPAAFQFRRAWKGRVHEVREQRQLLEQREGLQLLSMEMQQAGAAVSGVLAVPVGLGLYADATAPYPAADYEARLFGDVEGSYSVRTAFREMSLGVFEVGGTAHDWVTLPQTASYYEPSDSTDPALGRTAEFLRDVLDGMDGTVDFGQYDNDGPDGVPNSGDDDGYVDVMTFVYPNWAASCGGPGIWPHRWAYSGWWGSEYVTDDASANGGSIKVDDYTIQAGLACDGSSLMTIGTFTHEMGHALALPDLYDTDYSSAGIGHWGLMASGGWNRQNSPAHLSAWSKDFLGWVNIQTVSGSQPGTILDEVYTNGDVIRYDIPGTQEYYLLEHREPTGSDQYLHGPGLLIWHIDQGVIDANYAYNSINNDETRKGVDLEEADGFDDLDVENNRGDAGDVYPGSAGNTQFSLDSYPSAVSNDGLASGFVVDNIARDGSTVQVSFSILTFEDGGTVALGDSVFGELANGAEADTFELSLTAGDTVDLAAFNASTDSWWAPTLTLFDSTGSQLAWDVLFRDNADQAAIIPGYVVPATGSYSLVVRDWYQDSGGPYLLKARSSGPVVATDPWSSLFVAAQEGGGTVSDTIWVYNAGAGTGGWEATTDGSPWLSISPGTGTLAPSEGPSLMAQQDPIGPQSYQIQLSEPRLEGSSSSIQLFTEREAAPAGSEPLIVTVDPAGYAPGGEYGDITIGVPTDPWGGAAVVTVNLHVYDSQVAVVSDQVPEDLWSWGIDGNERGALALASDVDLLSVDSTTGGITTFLSGVRTSTQPTGMIVAPDSTIYSGDRSGVITTVAPDLTASTFYTGSYGEAEDLTLSPDGTLYAATVFTGIMAFHPDGSRDTLMVGDSILAVAYDPTSGLLYFGEYRGDIGRIDPTSGVVEILATELETEHYYYFDMEIGRSGLLYVSGGVTSYSPSEVFTFDPGSGTVVDRMVVPGPPLGLDLEEGWLYGTTSSFSNPTIFRFAVSDGPADLSGTYLAADMPATFVVRPDGTASDSAFFSTTDSAAVSASLTWNEGWLTASPTSGTTPFGVALSVDATGLLDGVYEDTLTITSSGAANSPLKRTVRMEVTSTILALGDTIVGAIDQEGERDTFYVALQAGDTIDLALFSPDYSLDPYLEVWGPDGSQVAYNDDFRGLWSLIPRFVAPSSGTYAVIARAYADSGTGSYLLKVRESGPVVATDPWWGLPFQVAAQGGTVSDTLWVYNAGTDTATFQVTTTEGWLSASPSSGTLPAPGASAGPALEAAEQAGKPAEAHPTKQAGPADQPSMLEPGSDVQLYQDASSAPAGSVPVVLTYDATGLDLGNHYADVIVDIPSDPWGGEANMYAGFRVFDSAITIATTFGHYLGGIGVLPDSALVVGNYGDLTRVDPATGAQTTWASGVGNSLWGLYVDPDTSVVVGEYTGSGRVLRARTTSVDTLAQHHTGTVDVTRLPDGTIYLAGFDGLYELAPGDTALVQVVAANWGIYTAVYHPFNGWVYFSDDTELRRYDPATGAVEAVGYVGPWITDMVVGESGRIYAERDDYFNGEIFGDLAILDASGTVLEEIVTPFSGWNASVTLADGKLWGATGSRGYVYSYPVNDAPVDLAGTYITVAGLELMEVAAGGSAADSITIAMTDGSSQSATVSTGASWVAPSVTGGTTPFGLELSFDATGLLPGVEYTDTLTVSVAGADNDPLAAVVRMRTSEATTLALGDSAFGWIDPIGDVDTVAIDLTAGDTVDFAVFDTGDGNWWPVLELYDPSGTLVEWGAGFRWAPPGAVLPAVVAPATGTYTLRIMDYDGDRTGRYVLKARSSGPVLATQPWSYRRVAAAQGGSPATDTIWVLNAGTGTTGWTVATDGSPWLSVSPTTGSAEPGSGEAALLAEQLSAGSQELMREVAPDGSGLKGLMPESPKKQAVQEAGEGGVQVFHDAAMAPEGASPVVVTVDPSGYSEDQWAVVTVTPDDDWARDVDVVVHMRLYDSRIQVVSTAVPEQRTSHPAFSDVGALTLGNHEDLLQVDTASGALSTLLPEAFANDGAVNGLLRHPNGSYYGASGYGRIFEVQPDLTVRQLFDGSYLEDVTVFRDGTVLAAGWGNGVVQVDPATGTAEVVAPDAYYLGIAYRPHDGRVYLSSGPDIISIHPDVGEEEFVLPLDDWIYSLEVGRSGLLYVGGNDGIYVVDPDGPEVVDYYAAPHALAGIELTDDWLYASTWAEGWTFRFPVSDGPVDMANDPYLFAEGDLEHFVVPAGGTGSTPVTVRFTNDATDSVTVSTTAAHVSVTPDAGVAPLVADLVIDASALTNGDYSGELVLSSAAALNDSLVVPFTYTVSDAILALGDSVTTAVVSGEPQEFFVPLEANDTVDFAAFAADTAGVYPYLEIFGPGGEHLAGNAFFRAGWDVTPGAVVPHFIAEEGGTYTVVVGSADGSSGDVKVKSRVAGPVVASEPWQWKYVAAPEGETARDTIWIYNAGRGEATFTVSTPFNDSWLSVSPSTGTLPGAPSAVPDVRTLEVQREIGEAGAGRWFERGSSTANGVLRAPVQESDVLVYTDAQSAPAGAVPVELQLDATGLAQGGQPWTTIYIGLDDLWAGEVGMSLRLQVHDPTITRVASDLGLVWGMARAPNGNLLVGGLGGAIHEVDPVAGGSTLFHQLDGAEWITDFAFRGDGAVLAADANNGRVVAIEENGGVTVELETGGDFVRGIAYTADGTLIALTWWDVWRKAPDGTVTATPLPAAENTGMAYDPQGERLYIANAEQDVILEFTLANDSIATHTHATQIFSNDMVKGSSGKVYYYLSCESCEGEGGQLFWLSAGASGTTTTSVAALTGSDEVSRPDQLDNGPQNLTGTVPGIFLPEPVPGGMALGHDQLFVAGVYGGAVYSLPVADGPIVTVGASEARVVAADRLPAGDTLDVSVEFDVTALGEAVADYQVTLDFNPSVVSYLSGSATAGEFDGSFTVDDANAGSGTLVFSGSGGSATGDTAVVATLRLVAAGTAGQQDTLRLNVDQLVGTGGTDATLGVVEKGMPYVITPGVLTVAMTTAADSVVRGASQMMELEFDLSDYPDPLGSGSGKFVVDTDVVWIDSVTTGSFGGSLSTNLSFQADSGWVNWAVASTASSTEDTVSMVTVWVSAVTENGAAGSVEVVFDGLSDDAGVDILPYLQGEYGLTVRAAAGIWGDVDYTWRLQPGSSAVGARDALICLNVIVEKDMSAWDTRACDVKPDAGTDYTGEITAVDALYILRSVVGMDTSDSRVETERTP